MKKTLIALAVAASAAVSGSAMAAWTPNLSGLNNFELGGTITPKDNVTPWEAMIGNAFKNLNSNIKKGQSKVVLTTTSAIPVLGIRTAQNTPFSTDTYQNATPIIDYGTAVDLAGIVDSRAPLTLEVKDGTTDLPIGTLKTSLFVGAVQSYTGNGSGYNVLLGGSAGTTDNVFTGGLPTSSSMILDSRNVINTLDAISTEFSANFDKQGQSSLGNPSIGSIKGGTPVMYSAYYGSGIVNGEKIIINLTSPVAATAVTWKASLPITLSYQ
ncbi:hypothetical protein IHC18_004150 [Escherichia coli]|nr:hypothetical protein [Escherichia coli]